MFALLFSNLQLTFFECSIFNDVKIKNKFCLQKMFLNLLDGMQQNIITWSIYLLNFILTIRLSQKI